MTDERLAAAATRLAAAVAARAGSPSQAWDVGTVQIVGGALAVVTGIAAQPASIGRANWLSTFTAQVAAGSVDGKRVLVLFKDRQPLIFSTMED